MKHDHGFIGEIDYAGAHAMLFPKGWLGWSFPKEDWFGIKRPTSKVPIDDQVWHLIKSNGSPRIERSGFLDRDPLFGWEPFSLDPDTGKPIKERRCCCPFFAARMGVVLSAVLASEESSKRSMVRVSASRWKRVDAIAAKLEYELARFNDSADFYFVTDGPDDTPTRKLLRLELFENVKNARLLATAEKNRLVPPHNTGDIWSQNFVISLGYTWFALTGEDPKGPAFVRFVDAAYKSLGGGGVKWTDHVRRAADRNETMPPFHRWGGHTIYTKAPPKKAPLS